MAVLFDDGRILARQLAAKLRARGVPDIAARLERCGMVTGHVTCGVCRRSHPARYACRLRWCPDCAWRLSAKRAAYVSTWAETCCQPKHVVLTARNADTLQPRQTIRAFAKLRRQKPFRWRRGCRSLEVTNEGRGWHVHIHALVDIRWIDQPTLARRWGKLVGQDFAVVWVRDARAVEYLAEVAKYVCKPEQMAKWSADECATLVKAMQRVRSFATFGDLRGWKPPRPMPAECEHCGATEWEYEPLSIGQQVDATLQHW